jgi:ketosteroid isomerase-like protein
MTTALETVQAAYAAFGRGDVPALLALLDEDVEWRFCGDSLAPYTGRRVGRDEVGRWFGQVAGSDDIKIFEPHEFMAAPDHVAVVGFERSRALPGGGTFDTDWVHLWQVADGRVTRFFGMLDSEAAAKARSR